MPKTVNKKKSVSKGVKSANTCCICLVSIDKGSETRITSCRHRYHYKCIKKWAHNENSCPQCRKRFNWVIRINTKRKESIRRKDQNEDGIYAFFASLLHSFFNNTRFRELMTIGIYERSRNALGLFHILSRVIGEMRTRDIPPSIVDEVSRIEAYTWLDTMEMLDTPVRLNSLRYV